MKKPILLATLSLVVTLGVVGVVNAATNPNNQQAVNSMLKNPTSMVTSANNTRVPASQSAGQQAVSQPSGQQVMTQQSSVGQPAVTTISPSQNNMSNQMKSTNMPMNGQTQNMPSNMTTMSNNHRQNVAHMQNTQYGTNMVSPNNGNTSGAMGSYASHTAGNHSMGMGR